MLDLMIRIALVAAGLACWGLNLWTLSRMAPAPRPVTPLDGFHRSVSRWGYVSQARGRA